MENNNEDIKKEEVAQPTNDNQDRVEEPVSEAIKEDTDKYQKVSVTQGKIKEGDTKGTLKKILNDEFKLVTPGMTNKSLDKLYEQYDDEEVTKELTEEQSNAFALINTGIKYSPNPTYYGFEDRVNDSSTFANDIKIDNGKNINIRNLTADDVPSGTGNQELLLSQFLSIMGRGEKINVPLWHSGFRVVISPPSTNDILALHTKVSKDQLEAGTDTVGLSYSNDSAILHKYFLELFFNFMESCTLDVNLNEVDIRDYISILDLNIMYTVVLAAMHIRGIDITTSCNNANRLDEHKKPICTFSVDVKINPARLLWIDTKRLSKPMLKQMSKMASGKTTLGQVKWYQDELKKHIPERHYMIKNDDADTDDIRVNFRIPTINDYLSESNLWLLELTSNVRESITDGHTDSKRDNYVNAIRYLMRLSVYNAFVKSISIRGNELTERDLIIKALTTNGKEDTIVNDLLKNVTEYIENSSVAVVAIPAFICPKCNEDGRDGKQSTYGTERLKELIPIDPSTLFFELTAHQLASLAE